MFLQGSDKITNTVKLLRKEFMLDFLDNLQLADTMRDLCDSYNRSYHEMSTATEDVWECIERVAIEIARRKTDNPQ